MIGSKVRRLIAVSMAMALAACLEAPQAAHDIPEDPRGVWYVNNPASTAVIDHTVWESFLRKYNHQNPHADGVSRIAYSEVSFQDRDALAQYVRALGRIPIATYNRDEQIAFWMNLYNSAIVDLVLDSMPVNSVLQIRGPGLNVVGPWLKPVARVQGELVSFNDIEHYILRAAFDDMDPPVHYGLNCASTSCPPLVSRAHTAAGWRENLAASARQFINDGQALRFEDGELFTSKIYHSWFKEDFGGTDAAVIEHLIKYSDVELADRLENYLDIAGDYYDWRLNKMKDENAVK